MKEFLRASVKLKREGGLVCLCFCLHGVGFSREADKKQIRLKKIRFSSGLATQLRGSGDVYMSKFSGAREVSRCLDWICRMI